MDNNYIKNGFKIISSEQLTKNIERIRDVFIRKYHAKFCTDPIVNRRIIKLLTNDILVRSFFMEHELVDGLSQVGIKYPVYAGPIVSHYTALDETGGGYGLSPHQDYPSMAGSENSVVVWTSIFDTNSNTHGLLIAPGSHSRGLQPGVQTDRGYIVNNECAIKLMCVDMKAGDILIMSSYLVHSTFINKNAHNYKLSLSARFDDFTSEKWRDRGFVSAYSTVVDRNAYLD